MKKIYYNKKMKTHTFLFRKIDYDSSITNYKKEISNTYYVKNVSDSSNL